MPQREHGPQRLALGFNVQKNQGFVMVIVVILISAVLSVAVIKTSLSSITHLETSQTIEETLRAEYGIEGCVSEALIQLKRDSAYIGGSVSLGSVSCLMSVSGSGNTRVLSVHGSLGNYSQQWTIDLTLSPFAITRWVSNP